MRRAVIASAPTATCNCWISTRPTLRWVRRAGSRGSPSLRSTVSPGVETERSSSSAPGRARCSTSGEWQPTVSTRPPGLKLRGLRPAIPRSLRLPTAWSFRSPSTTWTSYRLDVGGVAQPIARSSVRESSPQFSPDGRRIAFCSARSGDAIEVWVAGSDGSNPERLTRGPGQWQCSPAWSPDGRRIAFDSQAEDGSWHVWTIDAEGGTPQPITKDAGSQFRPTWSRNGEWIYFIWQRDEDQDIWRTRGPGQPHQRVTFSGAGTRVRSESPDGTGVYHIRLGPAGIAVGVSTTVWWSAARIEPVCIGIPVRD